MHQFVACCCNGEKPSCIQERKNLKKNNVDQMKLAARSQRRFSPVRIRVIRRHSCLLFLLLFLLLPLLLFFLLFLVVDVLSLLLPLLLILLLPLLLLLLLLLLLPVDPCPFSPPPSFPPPLLPPPLCLCLSLSLAAV